ncbi:MAG: hypothetical protein ABIP33_08060 [Pseudolysinimonas sp.]
MTSRLLPVLVGAAALVLLSGCSLGAGSSVGTPAGSGASGGGSSGSAAGSGGGSSLTGTCALLPPSKLSSITGKHYDSGDDLSPDGFGGDLCTYDSGIAVEVNTGDFTKEQQLLVSSTGAVPLAGVGDSAFYAAPSDDDNHQEILFVITGTKLVQVDDSSDSQKGPGLSLDVLKKIAAAVG